MIAQLIATPSISCTNSDIDQSNNAVIELLQQWLTDLGFHTHIQTVNETTGKYNLIASSGEGAHGLVLAGHTDTVPYDEGNWQYNPFCLTESDNRFYGLGTADMKGFFALILDAIRDLDPGSLKQPLIILATCDEETSMDGAKAIASHGLESARYAVIGEPTGLKPIRMHKGMMMESIQLTGHSGHSSNPAYGNNALDAMNRVITELIQWREELQNQYHNPLFEVPVPTMNLGHIHGGDNPNRICGHCELQLDIRPLPGMKVTDLRHEMQQRLSRTLEKTGITMKTVPLFDGVEAMETASSSELVSFIEKQTETMAEAVAFGTEAPYYNAMGIETVVMGPGNIAQAHRPDEYIETRTLNPAIKLIQQLIRHYCL